ncbi:hypothetical protein Glove_42g32 [Diversispora epigaea]|uniref:Ubiquitin-like protease family profile domain-containing protein n=1 Tax=Diversispora epigaea TaxID=1348612 RepID=A0A397JG02_9GLOM|nr:hypothetical protein Glove_42g32 [Diversispora epigaea]
MKGFKASSQSMQQSNTQDPNIIRLNSQHPSAQPQDLNIIHLNTTQPQDLNILHLNAQRSNTHDPQLPNFQYPNIQCSNAQRHNILSSNDLKPNIQHQPLTTRDLNSQRSHMQSPCVQRPDQAQRPNAQSSNMQHQSLNTKLPSIKELGISWVASDVFHVQCPITKGSIVQRSDMRREPGTSSTQNMNMQGPREASNFLTIGPKARYPVTQSRIAKLSDFQCPSIHELLTTGPKSHAQHPITQVPIRQGSDMQSSSIQDLGTSLTRDTNIQKTWTTSKLSTIYPNHHAQHPITQNSITKRSDIQLPSIQELGTSSTQCTQESSSLSIMGSNAQLPNVQCANSQRTYVHRPNSHRSNSPHTNDQHPDILYPNTQYSNTQPSGKQETSTSSNTSLAKRSNPQEPLDENPPKKRIRLKTRSAQNDRNAIMILSDEELPVIKKSKRKESSVIDSDKALSTNESKKRSESHKNNKSLDRLLNKKRKTRRGNNNNEIVNLISDDDALLPSSSKSSVYDFVQNDPIFLRLSEVDFCRSESNEYWWKCNHPHTLVITDDILRFTCKDETIAKISIKYVTHMQYYLGLMIFHCKAPGGKTDKEHKVPRLSSNVQLICITKDIPVFKYTIEYLLTKLNRVVPLELSQSLSIVKEYDELRTYWSNSINRQRKQKQQQSQKEETNSINRQRKQKQQQSEMEEANSINRQQQQQQSETEEANSINRQQQQQQSKTEEANSINRQQQQQSETEEADSIDRQQQQSETEEANSINDVEITVFESIDNPDKTLFSYTSRNSNCPINIKVREFLRLYQEDELNDNIVVFYLRYLYDRLWETDPTGAEQTYIFDSLFYERLSNLTRDGKSTLEVYKAAQRWLSKRKINLFALKYIFVPVCERGHWYLALVTMSNNNKDCHIAIFDSLAMKFSHGRAFEILKNFVCEASCARGPEVVPPNFTTGLVVTPKQPNAFDCGVYLLHFVETFLKNYQSLEKGILENTVKKEDWDFLTLAVKRQKIMDLFEQLAKNHQD